MEDSVLVTKRNTFTKLMHKASDSIGLQSTSFSMRIHIPFQILFAKLEYQHQFRFGVNDVMQSDNVRVSKFLHEGDFTNCGGRRAFFSIEMNLLESDNFVICA
jgi:hypothetical protein